MSREAGSRVRRFGVFELDCETGELRKRGVRVRLQDQPMRVLSALLDEPGAVVTREELMARLWPDDAVYRTDDNLNRAVTRLRQTLGDSFDNPRFIEGIRGRGYRFVAPLEGPAGGEEQVRLMAARATEAPLVGRRDEILYFEEAIENVRAGRGSVVHIGGEPGVGKTRLAEHVLQMAGRAGAHASFGRCYETAAKPPFIGFIELVERSARRIEPERLGAFLGDRAPEVCRLVPELGRLVPETPSLTELPPELQRRNIFNGFLEFLDRWSRWRPLVLLLDDLHAADPGTLDLLDHLADHVPSMPVLLLGTYRDNELGSHPRFARALEDGARKRLMDIVALKRFDKAGVREMIRSRTSTLPAESTAERVLHFTDGNPFYVEEVLRALGAEALRADADPMGWSVPESVRLVTSHRLSRSSHECLALLQTAATIGRDFSFELLSALELERVLESLEEAERARLIRFDSNGREARYLFEHELIRRTLLDDMAVPRRQRLHARVAEALRTVAPEAHAERVHHLRHAGSLASSAELAESLTSAAEQAVDAAAIEDALRFADEGLAPTRAIGPSLSLEARLLDVRGKALWALERWEEAHDEWMHAFALFETLGNAERISALARAMHVSLGWMGRFEEMEALATRAESIIGTDASDRRCRLLCTRALVLALGAPADYRGAGGLLDEAELMARSLRSQELEGVVLLTRTVLGTHYEEHRFAAEMGGRAISLLRPTRNFVDYVPTLTYVQAANLSLGKLDVVAALAEEVETLARRIGHRSALMFGERALTFRRWMSTGDLDRQEAYHRNNVKLIQDYGAFGMNQPYVKLGLIEFWRGDWDAAARTMERALSLEKDDLWFGSAVGARFLVAAYRGEASAMKGYEAHRSRLPAPGVPARTGLWELFVRVVEALAVLGELDEASILYPTASELAARGAALLIFGETLVQKVAGIAAAAGERWEEAEEHFEAALRHADEIPVRIEQPEVRRWYAWSLTRRNREGDAARANRLLTEALELYETIGMPRHAEVARRAQLALAIGQPTGKTP